MSFIDDYTRAWRPLGGRDEWHERPPTGIIIAFHRKPWRVVETREIDYTNWTDEEQATYQRMPNGGPPDEWLHRPWMIVLDPLPSGDRAHGRYPMLRHGKARFNVLSEHYAVCNLCHELAPCRHVTTEREVSAGQAKLSRLTAMTASMCWACEEPITSRQKRISFDGENLLFPSGPTPVRFHTRSYCHGEASYYEKLWVAADPRRGWRLNGPDKLEADGRG